MQIYQDLNLLIRVTLDRNTTLVIAPEGEAQGWSKLSEPLSILLYLICKFMQDTKGEPVVMNQYLQ